MDKRKQNGGHSTKAKGNKIDKRCNQYRQALSDAATVEDVKEVIQMVYQKAVKKQDIKAAQLFLEYYLGKPKQQVDVTSNEETISVPLVKFVSSE